MSTTTRALAPASPTPAPDAGALPAWRAALNRIRWAASLHLGWPGALALALLLAAGMLGWRTVPALQAQSRELRDQRLQRQSAQAAGKAAAAAAPPTEAGAPDAAALAWLRALPLSTQRGQAVATLLQQLGAAGVSVERADYSASDDGLGSARLEVSLPMQGSYAQVRRAVANVLQALPHAALQSLQLERPDTRSDQLRATAQFTLHFRGTPP